MSHAIFSPEPITLPLPLPIPMSPVDEMSELEMPSFEAYRTYDAYAALDASSSAPSDALRLPSSNAPPATCISTSQVFELSDDCSEYGGSEHMGGNAPVSLPEEVSTTGSLKRSSSTESDSPPKKPRTNGERIRCKDFVPPDVSGLSKREARLVKNRAAAFLSRQRKREEFEHMEVRVAQLEQENARLRNQTPDDLVSEVEQLRAQLAAAEARAVVNPTMESLIKMEDEDDEDAVPSPPRSRSRSSSVSSTSPSQRPDKTGASLGLMVLLCSLPTLLNGGSHGHSDSLATRFALPAPSAFPAFGLQTPRFEHFAELPADSDDVMLPSPTSLNLACGESNLDIAFDAHSGDDGKIRVRILPQGTSTHTSRSSSPFASSEADPVLGAPAYAEESDEDVMSWSSAPTRFGSPVSSEWSHGSNGAGKRRVRIALKSLPSPGGEGGEWEVEVC